MSEDGTELQCIDARKEWGLGRGENRGSWRRWARWARWARDGGSPTVNDEYSFIVSWVFITLLCAIIFSLLDVTHTWCSAQTWWNTLIYFNCTLSGFRQGVLYRTCVFNGTFSFSVRIFYVWTYTVYFELIIMSRRWRWKFQWILEHFVEIIFNIYFSLSNTFLSVLNSFQSISLNKVTIHIIASLWFIYEMESYNWHSILDRLP